MASVHALRAIVREGVSTDIGNWPRAARSGFARSRGCGKIIERRCRAYRGPRRILKPVLAGGKVRCSRQEGGGRELEQATGDFNGRTTFSDQLLKRSACSRRATIDSSGTGGARRARGRQFCRVQRQLHERRGILGALRPHQIRSYAEERARLRVRSAGSSQKRVLPESSIPARLNEGHRHRRSTRAEQTAISAIVACGGSTVHGAETGFQTIESECRLNPGPRCAARVYDARSAMREIVIGTIEEAPPLMTRAMC